MDTFEEKNIIKIATLYYEEGLTQAEIARKIGVSRSLVSKMLIDAREQGIVEITIHSKNAYTVALERGIEQRYKLDTAVVVDTKNLSGFEIEKMIGQAAAHHVNKLLRNDKKISSIGLSWGKTIKSMVDHFPYSNFSDLSVVSLVGGMGDEFVDIHSNQLSYDLARKLRGKSKYLYAPALLANEQLKQALEENNAVRSVLEEGKQVDIAIVGISNPYENSTMQEIGYITGEDIAELRANNVVGDINSRFFTLDGAEADCTINRSVIGINLADLSRIKQVVALACDTKKAHAVQVALTSGLLTHLIITDRIAQKLLEGA